MQIFAPYKYTEIKLATDLNIIFYDKIKKKQGRFYGNYHNDFIIELTYSCA